MCTAGLHNQSASSLKIIHHAKETLEYLKGRENFWKQQQPFHIVYTKERTNIKTVSDPPDPTLLDGATKHSNSKGVSILNSIIDDDDAFLRQMTTRHRPKTRQATPNNQETQVAVAIAAAVVAAVAIALAVWRRKSRHRREPQLKERSRRTLAAHRTKCRES